MQNTITGPWRPQASPHRDGLWETIDKRSGTLGQSFYNLDNATQWCAEQNDRALMDAAPDLLAALQMALDASLHGIDDHSWEDAAIAAIARATGED